MAESRLHSNTGIRSDPSTKGKKNLLKEEMKSYFQLKDENPVYSVLT